MVSRCRYLAIPDCRKLIWHWRIIITLSDCKMGFGNYMVARRDILKPIVIERIFAQF